MKTLEHDGQLYLNITNALDLRYDSNMFTKISSGIYIHNNIKLILLFKDIVISIRRNNQLIFCTNMLNYLYIEQDDIINFYIPIENINKNIYTTVIRIHYIT